MSDWSSLEYLIGSGALVVFVCIAYWLERKLLDRLDQKEILAAQTAQQPMHFGALSDEMDEFRKSLLEQGVDLSTPLSIRHTGEMELPNKATSAEILKSALFEFGFNDFRLGRYDTILKIQHTTRVDNRNFDRRCAFIQELLESHGWRYEGVELIHAPNKETH